MYVCTKYQSIWRTLVLGTKKKHVRMEYLDKRNLRITFNLSEKYYYMAGFRWFQVVSGWCQVASGGFRSFLVLVSTDNPLERMREIE